MTGSSLQLQTETKCVTFNIDSKQEMPAVDESCETWGTGNGHYETRVVDRPFRLGQ